MTAFSVTAGAYLAAGVLWCLYNSSSNLFRRSFKILASQGRLHWLPVVLVLASVLWLPGIIVGLVVVAVLRARRRDGP